MTPPERHPASTEHAQAGGDKRSGDSPSGRSGVRKSLNEAAHKLGAWPVAPAAEQPPKTDGASGRPHEDERDVVAHAGRTVLALGALGIVYGDIRTSPLYAE